MAGQIKILSAPIGGLNSRDNPEQMPETDAIVFENAISTAGHVEMRKGYEYLLTVGKNPIDTIFSYVNGENKYLMFSTIGPNGYGEIWLIDQNADIFLVPPPVGYRIIGSNWHVCYFSNRVFLTSVYGQDSPLMFDGEQLQVVDLVSKRPDIIVINPKDVMMLCAYKQRLFFIERYTSRLWFLYQAGDLSGECEEMDVSTSTSKGGYLVSLNEWSRAGNDETQSLLTVITSEGECIVYQGDDPSSMDWRVSSITRMPDVVCDKNAVSFRNDVAVITKEGLFTLNSVVGSASAAKELALSNKIIGSIKDLQSSYYAQYWQVIYLQGLNWILLNVPLPDGSFIQYVLNLENDTWSYFTGINSTCYTNHDDDVYFGTADGKICLFNSGGKDDKNPINMFVQTPYMALDTPNVKQLRELTLYIYSAFRREVSSHFYVDYQPQSVSTVNLNGAYGDRRIGHWNRSHWNQDFWGSALRFSGVDVQKLTTPVMVKSGRRVSIGVNIEANDTEQSDTVWLSTDVRYETGES
jgi:hypothetical protein